jgi:hypothetical protein
MRARDSGRNDLSLFHFGMAWRVLCHGLLAGGKDKEGEWKWRSAGDAQICKLSGFLELGMLALLFYCTGECPPQLLRQQILLILPLLQQR